MSIFDYPDKIFVLHQAVSDERIIYRRYAIDDENVYYRLIHEEELKYEDDEVEEGDYMLSKPIGVYRYLAINKEVYDNTGIECLDEFDLGDFMKYNMGDECLFKINQQLNKT